MQASITTAVVDTDDDGLRYFIYDRPKVFAKFTTKGCVICKALEPGFGKLAANKVNEDILFLRLDSDENPVAKLLMNQLAAPFFVSYCQGRILECGTHTTDAGVQAQLDRLRAYGPGHN